MHKKDMHSSLSVISLKDQGKETSQNKGCYNRDSCGCRAGSVFAGAGSGVGAGTGTGTRS